MYSSFGLGYVGLPLAVVFASKGYNVIGVDIDKKKVVMVNSGSCYIKGARVTYTFEKKLFRSV